MIVDGIEINVSRDDFDDFEVTECLAVMADEDTPDQVRLAVFKGDWQRVKDELRAAHGGRLATETVMEFFTATIQAVGAKN